MEKRKFTAFELKEFDGKEGRPAYVAVKGKVYDVSNSFLWKVGKHPGTHTAGQDLTLAIANAPHSEDKLLKFKVVGELIQEGFVQQRFVRRLQSMHIHSMLIHFPMAYSMAMPLLSFLYVLIRESSFEMASYYMLWLGFLAGPIAGAWGIFSWRVTYEGRMTRIFYRKILLTMAFLSAATVLLLWRALDPKILTEISSLSYIYLALTISFVPITILLGHYGGKLVYT